jgi:predicted Rossmann fold nucleotide-binding protein DprA/Smf involved in DNA uptake
MVTYPTAVLEPEARRAEPVASPRRERQVYLDNLKLLLVAVIIAGHGALVSPYEPDAPLTRRGLLARNRWTAELAGAVWVVQTGVPGGALAAAAHARRQDIPVLATPWDDPRWQAGYQSLIRHGAESVDVLTAAARLETLCLGATPRDRQGVLL